MTRTGMPRWWSLLLLTTLSFVSAASAKYGPSTTYVHSGGSIQKAIDKAQPGDTIIVTHGTYMEQLLVRTDHLTLIGEDATIKAPPGVGKTNKCTGLADPPPTNPNVITQAGICVFGKNVVLKDNDEHKKVDSVGTYICGVSISGFKIDGFSGLNIAIVGGQDTIVTNNQLSNSNQYGVLTVGSKNTRVSNNRISADGNIRFIGICMDDKSDVHVTWNHISNYYVGLCVQTNGAEVHDNDVSDGCIGAYVDPGVVGAQIHNNNVYQPNSICPEIGGSFGIVISGADKTDVNGNIVSKYQFGISISDYPDPPATATDFSDNNVVIGNILKGNGLDIQVTSKGTGNVIKHNVCKTPSNLCK